MLALGGCGGDGEPRLPDELAASVAAEADGIATELEDGRHCDAAARATELVRELVAEINARRVPNALQEELLGRANEVAGRIRCPGPSEPQAAPVARELADWARESS